LGLLLLPDELRSVLKEPLGKLCRGDGLDCVRAMEKDLERAKKLVAVGDMTAYYLLKAGIVPDLLIVDNKTKRLQSPIRFWMSWTTKAIKRYQSKTRRQL